MSSLVATTVALLCLNTISESFIESESADSSADTFCADFFTFGRFSPVLVVLEGVIAFGIHFRKFGSFLKVLAMCVLSQKNIY